MTEILTESFCERCGTRYTFQTAAPQRGRIGRLRVLSRGLKNYVLSDETSLTDAMADARNDEERSVSSQQLEAFHQTFNFCMSCRQYTCPNCWNSAENRCLSCAPDLDQQILPAPFPDLDTRAGLPADAPSRNEERAALLSLAWPEADLGTADDADGRMAEDAVAASDVSTPAAAIERPPVTAPEPGPALAWPEPEPEPEPAFEAALEPEPAAPGAEPGPPVIEPTPAGSTTPEWATPLVGTEPLGGAPRTEPSPPAAPATEPVPAGPAAPEVRQPGARPASTTPDERAAAAAAQTAALLGRFRPGQSLDEALEAYEREQAAAAERDEAPAPEGAAPIIPTTPGPTPQPAMPEPVPTTQPEPVPTTQPAAAGPTPMAPPTPSPAPASEPAAPGLAAAASAQPTPEARPPSRDDRVEQPVWRIVAPESPAEATPPPSWPPAPTPGSAAWPPPAPEPAGAPQWPSAAALPTSLGPTTRAREAMWAESSREVVASAGGGIHACVSCGLSLSATARFCRRCGSRQG